MNDPPPQAQFHVVRGITIDHRGQATIDPAIQDVLMDLALELEQPTGLPVDVQHVVAALVMARQHQQIEPAALIAAENPRLVSLLTPHVQSIFARHGDQLGEDL